jgi:hypothetical protein
MATSAPSFNPSIGSSSSAPPGDGPESDEATSYADASPPALVDPIVYDLVAPNVRVTAGKPRLVYELFDTPDTGHLWFPDLRYYGRSGLGEMQITLGPDSWESHHHTSLTIRTTDFGMTWSQNTHHDVYGFKGGNDDPRLFEDGRWYEWSAGYRCHPLGQARDFKCDYGYRANGAAKWVLYPWGSAWFGLPEDVKPDPTVVHGRHASHMIRWHGNPLRLSTGELAAVVYVTFVSDTGSTCCLFKSTDNGLVWNYTGIIAGPDTIVGNDVGAPHGAGRAFNENAIFERGGRLWAVMRAEGDTGGDYSVCRGTYSTDGGATWSIPMRLVNLASHVAPVVVQIDNGVLVLCTGRQGIIAGMSRSSANLTDGAFFHVVTHHNEYAEAGFTLEDDLGAGLIRAFREAAAPMIEDQSTCYLAAQQVSANRVQLAYDYLPAGRNAIGATGEPGQIYVMDLDITLL